MRKIKSNDVIVLSHEAARAVVLRGKQNKMEACLNVEKEQEKVLKKYKAIREHTDTTLGDLANHISNLQKEIVNCKLRSSYL